MGFCRRTRVFLTALQADFLGDIQGRLGLLSLFLILVSPFCGPAGCVYAAQAQGQTLVLGVHPYLPPAEIHRRFDPLANHLSSRLKRPVRVRIGVNYDEHIAAIGQDRIDVAFMGPASYVRMTEDYGEKPLLARFEVGGRSELHGVIAVRRDSTLRTVADLKGRRLALVDRDSTMGHIVPRYVLLKAGVPLHALAAYHFLGSHQNVAFGVLAGDFDAGAMKREVYDAFADQGLRILVQTPPTPDHVFVARANLSEPLLREIRHSLLTLQETPRGRDLLRRLHPGLTALAPASNRDFDALRGMMRDLETERP